MELNKKPFVGILAFLIVLFIMPLGHAVMILTQVILGETYQYVGAVLLGLLGFGALLASLKKKSETTRTFLGLFAGICLWTGFVEFSFVFYASHLGIPPVIENGEIVTKPEYLLIPSSVGILLSIMFYFFLNGQTRCGFFLWFRRLFRMNIPFTPNTQTKNYAIITAVETIFVLWAFYIVMMIAYDERIFGDRHWFTYVVFAGSLVWSIYLILRLIRYVKMGAAIRYAIPTVIIFWNCVELLGRWNFYREFWIEPTKYTLEVGIIFTAFVGAILLTVLSSRGKELG